MNHPRPWLRYVEADDLDTPADEFGFDDMHVHGTSGDHLGKVNGFVVDAGSGRPYYVVVDAGGWFKSKYFLVPIGHVAFDRSEKRLTADLTRERVHKFPGFDRDEFEKLSEDDLNRMDDQIVAACCPTEMVDRSKPSTAFDQLTHYKSPSWWNADFYRPDRVDRSMREMAGADRQATARGTGFKKTH
jgi:PRC-barrel domain protein